jgi:hypothetical protein
VSFDIPRYGVRRQFDKGWLWLCHVRFWFCESAALPVFLGGWRGPADGAGRLVAKFLFHRIQAVFERGDVPLEEQVLLRHLLSLPRTSDRPESR